MSVDGIPRSRDLDSVTTDGRSRLRRLPWTNIIIALFALAVLVGSLARIESLVQNYSTDLPFSDTWQMANISQQYERGRLTFDRLWRPQVVHRLVVPRLQALVIIELTNWDTQVMLKFNLGLVLLTGLLLLAAARNTLPSLRATLIVAAPILLVLLTLGRYHNWLKPFTDKIPTALGAAICVWALSAWPTSRWRFAVAIAGAVYASLSSVGGFATWIAFLPVVFLLNRRWAAIWAAVAIGLAGVYALNLRTGENAPSLGFSLIDSTLYGLAYLGAPLGRGLVGGSHLPSVIAGAVSLGLCLVNGLVIWRASRWRPPSSTVWIGLALFTMGAAAITALGRTEVDAPLSSRYQGISPLWWIAVIMIAALAVIQVSNGPARHLIVAVNVFALILGSYAAVTTSERSIALASRWMAPYLDCESAMLDYETAPRDCIELYGVGGGNLRILSYLERRGLSIFHE